MRAIFKNFLLKSLFFISAILLSTSLQAADNYSSQFINQSKQAGSNGYTLVKTRVWPENGCVIDSGKPVISPGESSTLIIAKKQGCEEAGIGYSMYKTEDTKNEHLLGYVSHRFRDGGFSLQVSVFCQDDKCVFKDLNPDQNRN